MAKWATVTVVDSKGERHSMDVLAESSYDAAHLYVVQAKSKAVAMMPNRVPLPTLSTVFEVTLEGKVYRVKGSSLQHWIVERKKMLSGQRGISFNQRPELV